MAQNKNTYQLFIQIGESDGNGAIAGESADTSARDSSIRKGVGVLTAYQVAQPFLNATKQVIANNVQTQYANTELSNRINIGLNIASSAIRVATNIAGGVSLATALGFGSPLGAGIGLALSVAEKVIGIVVKQNEINNQMRIENEQLAILRGRAGIQFNRSRAGE